MCTASSGTCGKRLNITDNEILLSAKDVSVKIGAVGCSKSVNEHTEIGYWSGLINKVAKDLLGIEMESASVYECINTINEGNNDWIHCVVAKGVVPVGNVSQHVEEAAAEHSAKWVMNFCENVVQFMSNSRTSWMIFFLLFCAPCDLSQRVLATLFLTEVFFFVFVCARFFMLIVFMTFVPLVITTDSIGPARCAVCRTLCGEAKMPKKTEEVCGVWTKRVKVKRV